MKINTINTFSFKAKISKKFKEEVKKFYTTEAVKNGFKLEDADIYMHQFEAAEEKFKSMGKSSTTIIYSKNLKCKKGTFPEALIIKDSGKADVLLARKPNFRELLDEFYKISISDYDVITQTANTKRKNGDVIHTLQN